MLLETYDLHDNYLCNKVCTFDLGVWYNVLACSVHNSCNSVHLLLSLTGKDSREISGKGASFQVSMVKRGGYRGQGNRDHAESERSMGELEEMQWSVGRQEKASESERKDVQNGGQTMYAVWVRELAM